MDQYVGEDMNTIIAPELSEEEKKIVLVTHDESCFNAHEGNMRLERMRKACSLFQRKRAINYSIPIFMSVSWREQISLTEELIE